MPHTYSRPLTQRKRSEEHTSELQSQSNLVCRLLLEKKNNNDASYEPALAASDPSYEALRPLSLPQDYRKYIYSQVPHLTNDAQTPIVGPLHARPRHDNGT